jgi:hypothetical protein
MTKKFPKKFSCFAHNFFSGPPTGITLARVRLADHGLSIEPSLYKIGKAVNKL